MEYKRSKTDPCLYWKYDDRKGLTVGLSWVDECCVLGQQDVVLTSKEKLKYLFECGDVGDLKEYVDW